MNEPRTKCHEQKHSIGRITTGGTISNTVAGSFPYAVTAGPEGDMWFTSLSSNDLDGIFSITTG